MNKVILPYQGTLVKGEHQAESVEALEMLGKGYEPTIEIEGPRKITARQGGKLIDSEASAFVKIYTSFKQELKTIEGGDLKVWIYLALSINRYTKDARPGLRTIAGDLDMAVNTVRAAIERLETKRLLDVEQSEGKGNIYHPSDYASVTKSTVSKSDTVDGKGTVSKSDTTVSKNGGTVSAPLLQNAQLEELELTREFNIKGDKTSNDPADDLQPPKPNIFEAYQSEIGVITPFIADDMTAYEKEFDVSWILQAIHIAAENSKRSWGYVKAVLKTAKEKGMSPELVKVEMYAKKTDNNKPAYRVNKKQPSTPQSPQPDNFLAELAAKKIRLQQQVNP